MVNEPMRFAIVDGDKVINVALAFEPLDDNWIASDTAAVGDSYVDGVFAASPPDYAAQWASVRTARNEKLATCDWTQLPDTPVDREVWGVYRQALRDITLQQDPFNIIWPVEPD